MPTWFDAHLDLACMAVTGRDMLAPLEAVNREGGAVGLFKPAGVTLPSLRAGGVRFALATIFTERIDDPDAPLGPAQYRAGDADASHRRGRAQLEVYETWRDRGLIAIDVPRVLRADPGVGEVRGGMGVAEVVEPPVSERVARLPAEPALHVGILMENADPIRSPEELGWWAGRGVCAVGLAWSKPSRYAAGNACVGEDDFGVSEAGRALVRAMDALGLVHDVSHLSDGALHQLLEITDAPVIASHSNCRSLLEGAEHPLMWQRHLSDASIGEIGRRGGVVGVNLYRKFLASDQRPATMDDVMRHVEHTCGVMGRRDGVGLGSDMDGGFGADEMCIGLERPADLVLLAEALAGRGWSDAEIDGFARGNWLRFWEDRAATA